MMKDKNYGDKAKDKESLLDAEILDFIYDTIAKVRMEIIRKKKSMTISDEEIVDAAIQKIDGDSEGCNSNAENIKRYATVVNEIMWENANQVEADGIIGKLKANDTLFIKSFFYGTNPQGCNILRFRSKLQYWVRQTYKVDVNADEIGNLLYEILWNKGSWSLLDKYSYKSSFFSWLEQITQHKLVKMLEESGRINIARGRTIANTRLLSTSISPVTWWTILTDIMPTGSKRDILIATLVDRKTKEEVMGNMGLASDEYKNLLKKAEADLKDKLIRGDGYYEEIVLRDKSARSIMVSDGYVQDFVNWKSDKDASSPLADVFGVNVDKEELQEKILSFLYEFPKTLKWTDEDRLVWRLRFIEDVSPVNVAAQVGRNRSWVDTRFSRLKVRFNRAIREWWKKNGE